MLARYERAVTLTADEHARLPGIMIARPLTLDLWSVAYGRLGPERAVARAKQHATRVHTVMAALAR